MRSRFAILAVAALGGLVVLGAAFALYMRGTAVSDAPIVYLSPTGSDSNACTKARPCSSFARVWNESEAGQTVELAAGTYGDQKLGRYALAAARADVVFRPAPGAKVTVGEVVVEGSHLEFRDMAFGGWSTSEAAQDVTFRRIASKFMFIWSSRDVRVIGGSIGPGLGVDFDSQITTTSGSQNPPTGILIDGVHFHDWTDIDPGQANHIECLQVGAGVNVVIRNSRFERCATHDIFIRSWGQTNGGAHPVSGWTLENNYFGQTLHGFFAIQIAEGADAAQPCENMLVRNNSFLQDMYVGCPAGGANGIRVEANILPSMASFKCNTAGSKWDYNVYGSGTRCGAHDRVGPARFTNKQALDLRLLPRSAAIDRGNPASFPARDIEGQKRPSGKAPDAGADERVVVKKKK